MTRVLAAALASICAAWLLLAPAEALACAVCWGAADSPMAKAAGAGILVLLAVIGGVLAWVAGMIVFFVRRAGRGRVDEQAGPAPLA